MTSRVKFPANKLVLVQHPDSDALDIQRVGRHFGDFSQRVCQVAFDNRVVPGQFRNRGMSGQFMAVTLPDGSQMGNPNAAPSANAGAGPNP